MQGDKPATILPSDADSGVGSDAESGADWGVDRGSGPDLGPYRLLGADGQLRPSPTPATLGGHRRSRIYGRLDCRAALQALARGGYVRYRVFFADADSAVAAGYRPCAVCLPGAYAQWKQAQALRRSPSPQGLLPGLPSPCR